MLGFFWQHGLGGARDVVEARRWYEQAANAGDADGQANLGWLYQEGLGVDHDAARAAQWYEKAAAGGSRAALINLGVLNEAQLRHAGAAADWYEKASASGMPAAAYRLGRMIEAGNGRRADPAQALVQYLQAAAAGIGEAQFAAARLLDSDAAGSRRPAEALRWFEAAATSPDTEESDWTRPRGPRPNIAPGCCAFRPRPAVPTRRQRWRISRAAARQKHPAAMLRYAQALERGEGQRADPVQALEWYRRSADLGDAEALFSLGRFYEAGLGTPSDSRQAMQYFAKAADKGHTGAKQMLNSVFGPPPDPGSRDRAFGAPVPFGQPSTFPAMKPRVLFALAAAACLLLAGIYAAAVRGLADVAYYPARRAMAQWAISNRAPTAAEWALRVPRWSVLPRSRRPTRSTWKNSVACSSSARCRLSRARLWRAHCPMKRARCSNDRAPSFAARRRCAGISLRLVQPGAHQIPSRRDGFRVFYGALERAARFGPWEPAVQLTLADIGLAGWRWLALPGKRAVLGAIERGTLRQSSEIGRLAALHPDAAAFCADPLVRARRLLGYCPAL